MKDDKLVFVYRQGSMMPICAEVVEEIGTAVMVKVLYVGADDWSRPIEGYKDTKGQIWINDD